MLSSHGTWLGAAWRWVYANPPKSSCGPTLSLPSLGGTARVGRAGQLLLASNLSPFRAMMCMFLFAVVDLPEILSRGMNQPIGS